MTIIPTPAGQHAPAGAAHPSTPLAQTLAALTWVNTFAALPAAFYTRVPTRGLSDPHVIHTNAQGAALLGLDPAALQGDAFLASVSGQSPIPGGDTLAAVYSGHQFGVWAGQLGDGRAHLLGEVETSHGGWEFQLKGAGMTPYSRMGDGRAVLRSSIREYLAAEAMAGLGVPTTRSLALVGSADPVRRETMETAAIVTRMAPSFVRFGSFEHWAAEGDTTNLAVLLDYVVDRFYPECRATGEAAGAQAQTALNLLNAVTGRTARLMADWQSVGFCHGVMNTDNMSILGLTLDYGPFGFMDGFDMGHVCNHSDVQARYAWNRQPSVGLWNLYRLAGALHPLVADEEALREVLGTYEARFLQAFNIRMAAKVGLPNLNEAADRAVLDDLLALMHGQRADFTLSFRRLSGALLGHDAPWIDLFIDRDAAAAWLARWRARVGMQEASAEQVAASMDRVNPLYVLRNHLAEDVIRAAKQGDYTELDSLMKVLREPYIEHPDAARFAGLAPDWASDLVVSCSS